jgi:hypothetical protein
MTDIDLVSKKLALVERCVKELRTLARPSQIAGDLREERFVERPPPFVSGTRRSSPDRHIPQIAIAFPRCVSSRRQIFSDQGRAGSRSKITR